MYAVVEIKGQQFKAELGAVLKVNTLQEEPGAAVEFDKVLMVSGEKDVTLGAPFVKGAKVTAVVESHGRDPKVIIYKFKKRKSYRRTQGHRQGFTTIKVQEIQVG